MQVYMFLAKVSTFTLPLHLTPFFEMAMQPAVTEK